MRKRQVVIASVTVVAPVLVAALFYRHWAWNETTDVGRIKLRSGGVPMRAMFFVHDGAGRGLSGVEVNILNNSGWNGRPKTDETGHAVVNVAELDIEELKAGQMTMRRPPWLGCPQMKKGLMVDVLIREPKVGDR